MSQTQASAYPQPADAYTSPPPPPGYPTKDDDDTQRSAVPVDTKSKGDGFWKGCCAALCCCCALDICF